MSNDLEDDSDDHDPKLPFGEIALLKELVTRDQLEELLHAQADHRDEGRPVKIATLLVREGILSKSQAKEILRIQRQQGPIAGYQLLELLGVGGMGFVFRARERETGRELALKILPPAATHNSRYRARFLREASVLQKLEHPHLVRCYSQGECEDHLYFAMEFVPGLTLRERIRREGAMSEAEVLRLFRQLAEAVRHYWAERVVHRDIKPENVLMTPEGDAKLADLGLCRNLDDDVQLTRVGKTLGTPLYISPELARGRSDIDIRSDLYSLGATVYHAACGVPPFEAAAPAELLRQHVEVPPAPPRQKNARLSEGLEQLLLATLEKEADDRPASPEEVLAALDRIERGEPPFERARRLRTTPAAPLASVPAAGRSKKPDSAIHEGLRRPRGSSSAVRSGAPASGGSSPSRWAEWRGNKLGSPALAIVTFVTLFVVGVALGSQVRTASVVQAQAVDPKDELVRAADRDPARAAQAVLAEAPSLEPADALARLDLVRAKLPADSEEATLVDRARAAARQRLEERGFDALEELRASLIDLVDARRWDEARQRLATFPTVYRGTAAWDAYEELRREVERMTTQGR